MDDLNEYNCPSCGANSNHKSIIIAFEVKIAELEKEKAELKSLLEKNISTFINKKEEGILLGLPIFEAYQLEQQAKGVQILLAFSFEMNSPASEWVDVIYLSDVEKTILNLFNKAKALKEGGV
jgi:hypothetical protein